MQFAALKNECLRHQENVQHSYLFVAAENLPQRNSLGSSPGCILAKLHYMSEQRGPLAGRHLGAPYPDLAQSVTLQMSPQGELTAGALVPGLRGSFRDSFNEAALDLQGLQGE